MSNKPLVVLFLATWTATLAYSQTSPPVCHHGQPGDLPCSIDQTSNGYVAFYELQCPADSSYQGTVRINYNESTSLTGLAGLWMQSWTGNQLYQTSGEVSYGYISTGYGPGTGIYESVSYDTATVVDFYYHLPDYGTTFSNGYHLPDYVAYQDAAVTFNC